MALIFMINWTDIDEIYDTFGAYDLYEYERQGPAPRSGLAPPMLIFQTSPLCNIFIKISKF